MRHLVVHKLEQIIRGMELEFKIKAPAAVNVEPILEKAAAVLEWAKQDPDQFGLFEEKEKSKTEGEGE